MDNTSSSPVQDSPPVDTQPTDPEAPYKSQKPRANLGHKMKVYFLLIGISIALSVVTILIFFFAGPILENPQKETIIDKASNLLPVAAWKTYTKAGFWEFKYPLNWKAVIEDNDTSPMVGISDTLDPTNDPNTGNIFLQVAGSDSNDSFSAMFEKDAGSREEDVSKTVTVLEKHTVDGYPAVTYSMQLSPRVADTYSYSIVTIIDGPTAVNISALALKNKYPDYETFRETYLPIHQKIVTSFTFAK